MTANEETVAEPPMRPLTADVLKFANKLHGLLAAARRADLAGRLGQEAQRWQEGSTTVVVAGDVKRGKSSLLNSLLRHPGLLPVDADVATNVHLVVRHGPELAVSVTSLAEDGAAVHTHIDPVRLAEYASVSGDALLRDRVVSVDIEIASPLLSRGLQLVDTPGVGGMSRGHRDTALAALQRADALIFTIASEPVARTELEFLAEASERIGAVVFVVTRADLQEDSVNASLLAENKQKLAAYHDQLRARAAEGDDRARELAERFERLLDAPFVLTSSYTADRALRRAEAGRAEQAEELWTRSGLAGLERLLDRTVDARENVRLVNVLQLAVILLTDLQATERARLRAVEGDRSIEDELAAQQQQLEQFASRQARWRATLATAIQRLQTEAGRKVARELSLVRNHYREVLDLVEDVEALAETLPGELERSLLAAWTILAEQANREFGRIIEGIAEEFDIEGMEAVLGDLAMPSGLREQLEAQARIDSEFDFLEDGVPLTMQTFMFGNMASAAASVLGLATGGLGLIGYGIGAAIALPLSRMRRKHKQRLRTIQEYTRVINEALFGNEGISKEFTTELTLKIIDARERIEELVDARLVARRKELEERRAELQRLLRAEAANRGKVKQEAEGRLVELEALRAEGAKLRDMVDRAILGPGTSRASPSSEG